MAAANRAMVSFVSGKPVRRHVAIAQLGLDEVVFSLEFASVGAGDFLDQPVD